VGAYLDEIGEEQTWQAAEKLGKKGQTPYSNERALVTEFSGRRFR
jgi:hypothetical protein